MFIKCLKIATLFIISTSLSYCSTDDNSNPDEITDNSVDTTDPETNPVIEPETNPATNPEIDPAPDPGTEVIGEIDPSATPGQNFNLSKWNLSVPIEENNGTATDITTSSLISGYENSDYFYTGTDGAMVFKNFIDGPKTSLNTKFTRSELREMNYGTQFDTQDGLSTKDLANNWVFGSSDTGTKNAAAAVDGELTATVKIDHVTTTGTNSNQVGRVVIGQIHASEDEPCRLYYQKLPNNSKGAIYFAHEPLGEDDQWHELIGERGSSVSNPSDGIELGELFSYSILVEGNDLTVTIIREGKDDVAKTIDMTNSGFTNDWMYFKAGVYTQNDSGDPMDYDEVSFYELEINH